jgi:cytochrome c oxidase subunit 2
VVAAVLVLLPAVFAACSGSYPNSTFTKFTDFNRDLTSLWNTMMGWGTAVFILVEGILIWAIVRYRRRPGAPEPEHVHGNTALELTWTLAPAAILVFIAVPTVRTIFRTQAAAPAGALQVQVIGHQWWWEFTYPELGITTANELYLPIGRAVNFTLRSNDVIHSFWIPQLGGKRDAVSNRTNYMWFTPDSLGEMAFNGSCNEYCGMSHANMRFRVFTVTPENFDKWSAHQKEPAAFGVPTLVSAGATAPANASPASATTPAAPTPTPATQPAASKAQPAASASPQTASGAAAPSTGFAPMAEPYSFPRDRIPAHVMPRTPIPRGLTFPDNLLAAGDPQRGMQTYSRSACIGCHKIQGNASSVGVIGPNLTHVGSRLTIGAGLYPNDARHLALWIKNARRMKPLSAASMPTLGIGETDPITKAKVTAGLGGLTDQQIADIVAYLMSLK